MDSKYIVCFAAHGDDIEFSATATIHKFMQKGYRASFVIMTDGQNGFKTDTRHSTEQRINIRHEEQLAVAEKMGLEDVRFLGYRDGFLEYTETLRKQLVEIIKDKKPEIIFSFDPANRNFDNINLFHRDHRIAGEVVFDAVFAAKNQWMYPGEAHRVKQIYFFGSHQPNYYENISDLIDFKLSLLACHRSQFPDFSKIERFIKEDICGQHPEYRYSEPFRILNIEQIT